MSGCSKQGTARVTAAPTTAVPMKEAPQTPITEKKAELGGTTWDPAWDGIIEKALPPEMLGQGVPQDVRRFCPKFFEMQEADKRAFWAYFFQALAGAEAGLDPKTRVWHTEAAVAVKDGVTGRPVRSEGLLQLTYEDRERYGCDFDWERDRRLPANDALKTILQPRNNLECGLKILDRQVIEAGKPLLSRSGYWSTLQPEPKLPGVCEADDQAADGVRSGRAVARFEGRAWAAALGRGRPYQWWSGC